MSNRSKPSFIAGARAMWVALAITVALPADASEPDAATTAAELEQLRDRIGSLRRTLDRDLGRQDRERVALRELEQAVATQAAELRRLASALRDGERRLQGLREDRDARQSALSEERAALAGQLRAAYATGRQERLRMLLNQEDPSAVGRMLVYYEYFNRARIERMERITGLLDALDTLESDIVAENASQARAQERQRATLAAMEESRDERAAVVAEIERQVRARGAELERLRADERSLQRLLESLTDLLADVPADIGERAPFQDSRGRLAWPVQGRVLARYGQRRDGTASWRGLLIAANAGSEVRVVAYGRVAWAGWMPHYGNLMVIEHGDGYYSLYGHTRTMLREVGAWVSAGDVIAEVGDSGGQPAPALYFELRQGRQPVNPTQWLVAR